MPRTLSLRGTQRLEGLCDGLGDVSAGARRRIRIGRGSAGIERLEARFVGPAFSPHRHDTYAIGVTLSGVQSFRYRGAQRYGLAGQCHVLHPDEVHDGGPGTETGFSYRIVYIDPALVQTALGGSALPFVADPIVAGDGRRDALPAALWRLDEPIDDVARVEIVAAVADFLERASGAPARRPGSLPLASLSRIRDLIAADPTKRPSIETLEAVSGLDRWALARQFRAAFGTSPSAFRTMRQLDRARRLIRDGLPLAEVAVDAGFADQSHMSRLFKRAYGLTPARWAAALA
jgi:AraC-like DNA-binding protein